MDFFQGSVRVGIGLRRPHWAAFLDPEGAFARARGTSREPDFVEIVPENFIGIGGRARHVLDSVAAILPIELHGVSLSVGGPDPLAPSKLEAIRTFADAYGATEYSDHLCASSIDGVELFDLLPVPFHERAVRHVAERARRISDALRRPLLLENITRYAVLPSAELPEGEFYTRVLQLADARLLLDVSNIIVTARNLGGSPSELLAALPLERTARIHLGGYRFDSRWGITVDDHASAPSEQALRLLCEAVSRLPTAVSILIEWDQSIPDLCVLLSEVHRVRAAVQHARSGRSAA
jgi:uncharacterized protein